MRLVALACAIALIALLTPAPSAHAHEHRPLPDWFDDAKFGIFIHWGPAAVPGYAPVDGTIDDLLRNRGPRYYFRNNPYSEWYLNSMQIPGSPTARYHADTYGAAFPYDGFIPEFDAGASTFDPDAWAQLFADAGARYMVLTTKHHDGFLLWPSAVENPNKGADYHTTRDVVADVTEAMRNVGIRMGLYYSGGYDWTYEPTVIKGFGSGLVSLPRSQRYADDMMAHFDELIGRYSPDILWNDIVFPGRGDLDALLERYYAAVPDGVVNDRFSVGDVLPESGILEQITIVVLRAIGDFVDWLWNLLPPELREIPTQPNPKADFATAEYAVSDAIRSDKWEATRGVGVSFGFNRADGPEHALSIDEAVHMLVDVVSKNGNLLLGVGPDAAGIIPQWQQDVLVGIGAWLAANGAAIYGTVPWERAAGTTGEGLDVRFTHNAETATLYATLLARDVPTEIVLTDLTPPAGAEIEVLGLAGSLDWDQVGDDVAVSLPAGLPDSPATVLAISP